MTRWRFLTWNLDYRQRHPQQMPRLQYLASLHPTIAALQEVPGHLVDTLADTWGPRAVLAQKQNQDPNRRYIGSALLLSDGATVLDAGLIPELPQPRRGVWARVRLPDGSEVTAASWHAPYTDRTGITRKTTAYEAVTDWCRHAPRPLVLGADLNTWRDTVQLLPALPGEKHEAEHAFVGPEPRHGLVDAHRTVLHARGALHQLEQTQPDGPLAVSYELRSGAGQRMDRIFADPTLRPSDSSYEPLDRARAAGSDHAPHWVDFA